MFGTVVAASSLVSWVIAIALWAVFLIVTVTIARMRGRSGLRWALLAVFLPLISIILLLVLPAHETDY